MQLNRILSFHHSQNLIILLGLSYLFLMAGNGALALTNPDEVFYIQSTHEMMARHTWMTPYIFDAPQFEKPIFSFWMFILSIKIFGLTPFASRFAPALFGMIGVVVIYVISWFMFGNKRLSFLSGLVLLSSMIYLGLSRAVLTDMIFSVWVMTAIGCFWGAYHFPDFKRVWIIIGFGVCGLAVLTKGLLGFCFPVGTMLIFLLLRRDFRFLRNSGIFAGFCVMLAISLPWHLWMWQKYSWAFVNEYFFNDHIRRIVEAEHDKSNTWYFYPLTVIGGVMPWTFVLGLAIGNAVKSCFKEKENLPFLFLFSWMLGIFIFVQPAQSKLASYIMPIFPAVVIMIAGYLENVAAGQAEGWQWQGFKIMGYSLVAVLGAGCFAAYFAAKKFHSFVPSLLPIFWLILILVGIATALFICLRKKAVLGAICVMSLLPLGLIAAALPVTKYAGPWVSCEEISRALTAVDHSDTVILSSKFYARGVRFYTQRKLAVIDINGSQYFSPHPILFLTKDEQVKEFVSLQPYTFCVVKKSAVEDLKRITKNYGFPLVIITQSGDKYLLKITNPVFQQKKLI